MHCFSPINSIHPVKSLVCRKSRGGGKEQGSLLVIRHPSNKVDAAPVQVHRCSESLSQFLGVTESINGSQDLNSLPVALNPLLTLFCYMSTGAFWRRGLGVGLVLDHAACSGPCEHLRGSSMALVVHRTRHCWGRAGVGGVGRDMLGCCFSAEQLVTLLLTFLSLGESSGKSMLDSRVSESPPSSGALQLGDLQKENCVRL